jgi:DNA polymerase
MKRLHNALKLRQLLQLRQLGYRYTDMTPSDLEPEPAQLPGDLESLRKMVDTCHLCDLAKSRHKTVFGEGDPHARLMFVGEGPGATEDRTGRPFVGRAGELLTRMIENVLHLRRDQVYIANIVKCRPPGNRVPTPTEAFACRRYLLRQIDIVRPRIVVTLGATAYRYLANDESPVGKVRGHIIHTETFLLIPTYHPSFLLRNPSAKKDAWEDLLKVKELLDTID